MLANRRRFLWRFSDCLDRFQGRRREAAATVAVIPFNTLFAGSCENGALGHGEERCLSRNGATEAGRETPGNSSKPMVLKFPVFFFAS